MDSQPGPLESSVAGALAALDAVPTDQAAAELLLTCARELDNGGDLVRLGGLLLAALDALLLTPRSRAAAARGGTDSDNRPASPLDELRARRAARQHRAEAVDPAAS